MSACPQHNSIQQSFSVFACEISLFKRLAACCCFPEDTIHNSTAKPQSGTLGFQEEVWHSRWQRAISSEQFSNGLPALYLAFLQALTNDRNMIANSRNLETHSSSLQPEAHFPPEDLPSNSRTPCKLRGICSEGMWSCTCATLAGLDEVLRSRHIQKHKCDPS